MSFITSKIAPVGYGPFLAAQHLGVRRFMPFACGGVCSPSRFSASRSMSTTSELLADGEPTLRPSLDPSEFFNRVKEIKVLGSRLNARAELSVLTGHENSGKTALITKVLEEKSKNRPVAHIECSKWSFSSPQEVVSVLQNKLYSELGWVRDPADSKLSLIASFNQLFQSFEKNLPKSIEGGKAPILFIDEVDHLVSKLSEREEDKKALIHLFQWFVQNQRFHVILSSSSSYFHPWVRAQVDPSCYKSYVVGDLPKEDALRFWNEKVICGNPPTLTPPGFEDAYSLCGGKMFYLKQYNREYLNQGNMTPHKFSLIGQARSKIEYIFEKTRGVEANSKVSVTSIEQRLIWLMQRLVNSEKGYFPYNYGEVDPSIEQELVDGLIAKNIFYLTPLQNFDDELPGVSKGALVVTAETPLLYVMKKIVNTKYQK